MDQRANLVEQDIKDIVETRLEISRKIRLIEDNVRYEMENLKTKWSGLTGAVAETGKEFIDQSARTLDPARPGSAQPWAAFAGVVLFGVAIGALKKRFRRPKVYPYYPPKAHGVSVMPTEREKKDREPEGGVYPFFPEGRQKSDWGRFSFLSDLWSDVKADVRTEIRRSEDAIGYALREFVRDMAKEAVPTILKSMASPQSRDSRR